MRSDKKGWIKRSIDRVAGRKAALEQNLSGTTDSGSVAPIVVVNDTKISQLSTVWACVDVLSKTVATLPLGFYERTEDGRKTARDHPLYEILHYQPNADMTAVEFWEMMMAGLLLRGNAYARIERTGKRVTALTPMVPEKVKVTRDKTGAPVYTYQDPVTRKSLELKEGQVLHIRGRLGPDCLTGLSPIKLGKETFALSIAANAASAALFKNGMRPSGVLKIDRVLTEEQRKDFREGFINQFTGSLNAGRVPLLEAGINYQNTSLSLEDAQMIETRRLSVEDVCQWFGVDPIMIGHAVQGQTMWGSGVEQLMMKFLTTSLRPWLTRIEQAIRRSLLAPGDKNKYFAEFAIEGLLRADSAARAAFYSTMTQNGVMTRNEARHKENLPPQPGGDQLTVQSNLLPLDQLGRANDTESAKNALRDWLGIDKQKEDPACTGKTQP
ncbi:phage portal protein [Salmonella enterica]